MAASQHTARPANWKTVDEQLSFQSQLMNINEHVGEGESCIVAWKQQLGDREAKKGL